MLEGARECGPTGQCGSAVFNLTVQHCMTTLSDSPWMCTNL